MALNAVRFYRNESCGKCVPCRIGSQKLVDMLTFNAQDAEKRVKEGFLALLTQGQAADEAIKVGRAAAGR